MRSCLESRHHLSITRSWRKWWGPLWPQLSRSEGHMQVYWQEANKQRSSNKLSKVPLKLHASPLSWRHLRRSKSKANTRRLRVNKKEERYKAKIKGYVPRFHTKYFNHAISVILPFCFAKIKNRRSTAQKQRWKPRLANGRSCWWPCRP